MGQFHIDFDMDGAKDEIYSIESYFLAKKVYIDILESKDKENNIIRDSHIRLKSVPNSSICYEANKCDIVPIDIYKKLYDGEKIKFDLLNGGEKCGFKFERDMSVRSYNPKMIKKQKVDNKIIEYEESEFIREISFNKETERIEIN